MRLLTPSRRPFIFLSTLSLLLTVPLVAQAPRGCTAPEYRQFDFWTGEWTVTVANGRVAGSNRIESILGGCALQEHWTSAAGGHGTSLNMWNAADSTWRQVWIDASGNLLELSGALRGKEMVLSGTTRGADGRMQVNRITWTPAADGTVRQLWESSTDDGASWTVQFDGRYARKP